MTRQNVEIVLVAVALSRCSRCGRGQTEELVRVIPMEPGGQLTLANISGEIVVTWGGR